MTMVGVPYTPEQIEAAGRDARSAAEALGAGIRDAGGSELAPYTKLMALIAYLQRLGHTSEASASLQHPPAPDLTTAHTSRAAER